jgi:hypothetical protein
MTAVDFLVSQIINKHRMAVLINNNNDVKLDIPKDVIEVAKAMEKEQIIQSYYAAVVDTEMIHEHKKFIYEGPEQYYNETYKK